MDKGMDDDLDDLEEVEYLEDMEDAEVPESAPPYPGHPVDYGGKDASQNELEIQAPPYTVNMAYAASPEPGLKTGVHNPYFQAGPNPGMYPQAAGPNPGMYPQVSGPNPGMYPQVAGPNPGMYPPAMGQNPGMYPQPMTMTNSRVLPSLRDHPGHTMCPHCKHQVITITDYYSGLMAWLACGCLALVGCWPCCIAPFWMDSCKDVEHRCPNCNKVLSFYKRL
ncbi:lipopolysaccharide-induced tumor necrosis factor-alpha factor homolog [Triplophysa dalaica]|uniref:lipopolysaccharide-induced tumor necrosis factor-alpha factor homolog n=1 Tax=Triplophysa dalaica TaxID=1582913 RepID=UPI0024DF3C71|nr:lipopolysaccharide-induced tumor necrosis factor-alpha factor homolog [Triplophysa dalaica]